jgi:radical SAM superfamily enzyme
MKKMQKQYQQICLDLVKAIPMHMLVQRVMAGI